MIWKGVKTNNLDIFSSVGSELKLGLARLGSAWFVFGSSFWEKKLGSARLALSFKKTSYLEEQNMS